MKLRHEKNIYPPRLTIIAHSHTAQWATICIDIKGLKRKHGKEDISFEIPKQFGSQVCSIASLDAADGERLQLQHHFNTLYTTLYKSLASNWVDFGIHLDINPLTIDRFKKENDKDVRACFREVLIEWLKQIKPPPTKSKILQVLTDLGFSEEAQQLESNLVARSV